MESKREPILDALGPMSARRIVDEGPRPERLAGSNLGDLPAVREERHAPFHHDIERVGGIVRVVDQVPLEDLDLAGDVRETEQMARSDVFQKIGALEHQHSFDGCEHGYSQAAEVRAPTPGSIDPSSPLKRASTSARTTALSSEASAKARRVSDGAWRETCTAHAFSQGSPEFQAARIH